MKRKYLRQLFILTLVCYVLSIKVNAQDMHLSQYFESPITLNPATAGLNGGAYRAHLQQRTQWMSLVSKPFLSEVLSFDMPYNERFGMGAVIINNSAGSGNLNEFHFLADGSFLITEPNDKQHLATGIQMGFVHKSVNPDKLLFDSQYNEATGEFDSDIANGEDYLDKNETLFDLNFGIQYYTQERKDLFKKRSSKGLIPMYAGFSAFHLIQPKEKFITRDGHYYRRWLGYAGAQYMINQDMAIEANLLYMRQIKNNDLQMGAIYYYRYQGGVDYVFSLGSFYRWKDAVVLQLGFGYDEFDVAFSYDINVSSLKVLSHGRGGFEISITYVKKASKIASFFKGGLF